MKRGVWRVIFICFCFCTIHEICLLLFIWCVCVCSMCVRVCVGRDKSRDVERTRISKKTKTRKNIQKKRSMDFFLFFLQMFFGLKGDGLGCLIGVGVWDRERGILFGLEGNGERSAADACRAGGRVFSERRKMSVIFMSVCVCE